MDNRPANAHKTRFPWVPVPGYHLRRLAVEADAHPDTVRRYLAGRRIRGPVADRVADACARAGLEPLDSAEAR